jgi:hypothetical protein
MPSCCVLSTFDDVAKRSRGCGDDKMNVPSLDGQSEDAEVHARLQGISDRLAHAKKLGWAEGKNRVLHARTVRRFDTRIGWKNNAVVHPSAHIAS